MKNYNHLTHEQLIALLQRREREAAYGLTWERDKIDPDKAMNDDFVALDLDRSLSHGDAPWRNLIIEGDNYDALRFLRMTHAGKVKCMGSGIVLIEMKGPHLQQYEAAKASARHKEHGMVFMVGYDKEKKNFRLYREENGAIHDNGLFETSRLRFDG